MGRLTDPFFYEERQTDVRYEANNPPFPSQHTHTQRRHTEKKIDVCKNSGLLRTGQKMVTTEDGTVPITLNFTN